ncbi:2Fe-2S iron-sulfur cluster-binding protein [Arthrobacter sp. SAFR-044]|uniref:2Fe-2S iron-sulfur cluster-binding protein n=1 Tax=Arthrobacter sp. SAFR-044 TaxID=3387278 RepID=UPI003F7C6866
MPEITYTLHNGQTRTLNVPAGTTVMKAATSNGVPGIIGECGGVLSCATCHVFIDGPDLDRVPPMTDLEDEMLEGTAIEREDNSRLACQIHATDDTCPLHVTIPEYQQ